MKNYVQRGDILTLPAPAAVVSGDVVVVGSLAGIASTDAASGGDVEVALFGVFSVAKAAGEAISPGAPIYWDAVASRATLTETDNTRLGTAAGAATSDALRIEVRLTN